MPVQGASISTRSMRPSRSASSSPTDLRRAHLHVARAGALEPLVDRREPALVVVGGVDLALVLHHGGQRQRLAAAAGAEIDHLLAGLGAGQQRRELRALVLDFDQALEKGGLGVDRRALGVGAELDAQAVAATSASARARDRRALGRLVARGLQRVDAQIERRAGGERRALLGALVAEARARDTDRAIPDSRPRTCGGAPARSAAASRARSASVSGAGAIARAVGQPRDRVGIEPALAHAACRAAPRAACPRP